jgi:hypothetical protein
MNATVYTQRENTISGRKVWLYLISSPIGNIVVVDYEQPTKEIVRKMFDENYEQAEKYFDNICKKIIGGKI